MYDCVVSGPCGSVTSAAAALTCRPMFAEHPQGGAFGSGAIITLRGSVISSGTASYRWRRHGIDLVNTGPYSGVFTPTLVVRSNDPGDSGVYTLAATNGCGTSSSDPAVVDVFCVSDFNTDGGVDFYDVEAFFNGWELGAPSADVNADGGVDGQDLFWFFERWSLGC